MEDAPARDPEDDKTLPHYGAVDPAPGQFPEATRDRPLGVTILAVLYTIGAVVTLLAGIGALQADVAGMATTVAGVLFFAFAAVSLAVAYGLWRGKRWGWYAAVVLEGFAVVSSLLNLLAGNVLNGFLGLAVAALILWYLLKPDVQTYFGVSYATPWTGGRPT